MPTVSRLLCSVLSLTFTIWLLSCREGGYACMAPPPSLNMVPQNSAGQSVITPDNRIRVRIDYYDSGTLRTIASPVRGEAVSDYTLISISRSRNDTTRFFIKLDERLLGTVQLKTRADDTPCNPWDKASEVRVNGSVVPLNNSTNTYPFLAL